jgi:hypothetical protein
MSKFRTCRDEPGSVTVDSLVHSHALVIEVGPHVPHPYAVFGQTTKAVGPNLPSPQDRRLFTFEIVELNTAAKMRREAWV